MNESNEQKIRQLFDGYLRMYSSRDDRLTSYFSADFSGFSGGGDVLVKDRNTWISITRQDFAQVKEPLRIELLDLSILPLSETIAVATGFFHIHLPIKDHVLSRETARLVVIFRQESGGWKICHSSISVPYNLVREGEVYPLQKLEESHRILEEQVAERTRQLSQVNAALQQVNKRLAQEIAEHKKADEALQKSESHFRIMSENISDVVWRLDSDYRFTYISPSDERLRGYSAKEVLGTPIFEMLDEEGIALVRNLAYQRQQAELKGLETGSNRFEARHRCKDGKWLWVEVSATPQRDLNGTVIGHYGISREITERKQAEEQRAELEAQLRQKHKMEAVGYMAGGMAHNFNNNLGIILGSVELAELKQPPGSDIIPLLKNAKKAVRRSRDLILKIITYSRQGIQQKAPMQLTAIINETISLLRPTLPATVALQKGLSPGCETELINADASQIQEVLINLCNNAIHAMNEKGEIKIQLGPVELINQQIPVQYDCLPGRYARISVHDNGCGMPEEMLNKIFDPFYTTKEEHEGAGMGLATVQGIVAQHGGFIKVNSALNQGTTFDLYFPIIEQTQLNNPTAEDKTLPRGTESILFVDDDAMLASLGEQLLTGMGYQVCVTTDSPEALKMFTINADHFDLVITDQTMPQLSGKDLIEELKKVRADIPTILCTGYSSKIDEEKAKKLGINAFMMKPLGRIELAQTVRRVLDKAENE